MVWFISFIHEVSSIHQFIYVYFNASNDQKCIYFKAACNWQGSKGWFSFIGNSTLRSLALRIGERLPRDRVWAHIESRQFIGWWRDAVSDAMTSSGHTGERTIHSSDFSAFTKRSYYPSLLRFLAQLTFCEHHIAVVNRRARDSSLAMTRTDK